MELFTALRAIHIAFGIIGFIVAPVALIAKKGGDAHRRWGKVFFWSMTVVAFTAVIMAPMHNNIFLTLVAVFSFYLAFTGYRSLYRKDAYKSKNKSFLDWFFVSLNTIFSASLLIFGITKLPGAFGVISIVFGITGVYFGMRDVYSFLKPHGDKNNWLYSHMIGMTAAYIAAMSAFSAVNLNFEWLPVSVQWLWPTIIGVPLTRRWVQSYRKKFSKGRKVEEEVEVKIEKEKLVGQL